MAGNAPKKFGILKILALVVLVLLIAIIAAPFLLDVNQFRPQFESRLAGALGREVKFGNLKLSILSGSLGVEDISIADNPEFSNAPFVTAESLKVGVELKPLLFSKEVRVTGITLEKPAIHLVRSASGKWNFSDLGGKAGAEKAGYASSDISGTDILIRKLEIAGGRVTIVKGSNRSVVYDNVNLTTSNLSFTSAFPFALNASLPGGGQLKMDGEAGPLNKADMLETPMKAEIAVTDFDLVASGFVPQDSGLSGLIDFNGNATSDGSQAKSKGTATVKKLQVAKSGSPAGNPVGLEYSVNYDMKKRGGTLTDVKVHLGKAVAYLDGDFGMSADSANLRMKLRGTNMPVEDLATMLPAFGVILPKGASLQGGSMNVDLTAQGPVDGLVTAGTADLAKTRLVGFDLAGKMSGLAQLAGIQSNQETEIEKLAVAMRMAEGAIQISSLQMIMPALGSLSGAGRIAADQTLDFTMRARLKPSGAIGAGLTQLTGVNALDIPFFIRGNASDPKFIPDTRNAAGSILGSVLSGSGGKDGKSGTGSSIGDALGELFKKK